MWDQGVADARADFDWFRRGWADRSGAQAFRICAPFEGAEGGVVYRWVVVEKMYRNRAAGHIEAGGDPVRGIRDAGSVEASFDELVDWSFIDRQGSEHGSFTAEVVRLRAIADEAARDD